MWDFNSMNRRLKKIREKIGELPPLLTVHYADGTQRTMREVDAITEAVHGRAVKITAADEKADGCFVDLLNAIANIEEIWPEGYTGDTPQ